MKRLRKRYGQKIRFYHCGEYGESTPENNYIARPHYHACIFNLDFNDKTLWSYDNGNFLYHSETLEEIWGKGFVTVGEMNFQSAAYCARYVLKKINGEKADTHYETVIPITGEIIDRQPEYTTMSRRPGIGQGWYKEFKSDVYPSDFITTLDGLIMNPPKYYDNLYEIEHPLELEEIKKKRKGKMSKHLKDNTPERLYQRETVKLAQLSQLKRNLK